VGQSDRAHAQQRSGAAERRQYHEPARWPDIEGEDPDQVAGQEKPVTASDVTWRMTNRWTDMRVRNPADRRTIATLAVHSRWAAGPDRQAARQLARRGLELRFARQVDVDGFVKSWRSGSRTPGRRKWRG
jgi:hypothetical protein